MNNEKKTTIKRQVVLGNVFFGCILVGLGIGACAAQSAEDNAGGDDDDIPPVIFHKVCKERICDWELSDGGDFQYGVPTWHEKEAALGLVGEDVSVYVVPHSNEHSNNCFAIAVAADTSPGAELHIEVDLLNDGEIEHRSRAVAPDWAMDKFPFKLKPDYGTARFSLVKKGKGSAAIYFAEIISSKSCPLGAIEL